MRVASRVTTCESGKAEVARVVWMRRVALRVTTCESGRAAEAVGVGLMRDGGVAGYNLRVREG